MNVWNLEDCEANSASMDRKDNLNNITKFLFSKVSKQVISPTIKGDLPSTVDMYPGSVHGAMQWTGVAD